jgi:hypothetical protein
MAFIELISNTSFTRPITISVFTLENGSATRKWVLHHMTCDLITLTFPLLAGFQQSNFFDFIDFLPNFTTLVFPLGSRPGTTLSLDVAIINDTLVENTETINIQAMIQGNTGSFVGGGVTANAVMNIIDDDGEFRCRALQDK